MASTLPRDNTCNTCCNSEPCCDSTEDSGSGDGVLQYTTVADAKSGAPAVLGTLVVVTGADPFDVAGWYLAESTPFVNPPDDVVTFQVGAVYYNKKPV